MIILFLIVIVFFVGLFIWYVDGKLADEFQDGMENRNQFKQKLDAVIAHGIFDSEYENSSVQSKDESRGYDKRYEQQN